MKMKMKKIKKMSFQNKTKKKKLMNHKKMKIKKKLTMLLKNLMMKMPTLKNEDENWSAQNSSGYTETDWSREVAKTASPENRTSVISVDHTASRETTTNAASNTVEQNTADTVSPEAANSVALTTGDVAIDTRTTDFSSRNLTNTDATEAKSSDVAIDVSLNDSAFADLPDSTSSASIIDTTKQSDSYLFLLQQRNQDFLRENGKRKFVFVKFLV